MAQVPSNVLLPCAWVWALTRKRADDSKDSVNSKLHGGVHQAIADTLNIRARPSTTSCLCNAATVKLHFLLALRSSLFA